MSPRGDDNASGPGLVTRGTAGVARRWRAVPLSPDSWGLVAVAAAVLLANLPYLLGFSEANPLGPRSGLLRSLVPGHLGGEPTIDPNNGFISQALSHRAALDWIHLRIPWWNPYSGTGAPLAGETQSAALFPPTLLALLAHGQLLERMLLELVAGLSTFALLRRLALSPWAAAAAGIAFALNGTFAWFAHASMNPVAFLPLMLLGVERAFARARADQPGGWGLLALAGAGSVYAGFPETAYLDGLLVAAWVIWRAADAGRARVRALLGKVAAGALVAVLLAAPSLIASAGFLGQAALGSHESGFFAHAHLPAQAFPSLVLPYVYGPIFGFDDPHGVLQGIWGSLGGFLAPGLVLLALLGLVAPGRRGLRIALAGFLALVLARMYGAPPGLRDVLGVLPRMGDIIFYRYAFPAVEMAVIVLAALGLDSLVGAPAPRRRLAAVAAGCLALVGVAALAARPLAGDLGPGFADHPYQRASVALGLVSVLAIAVACLLRAPRLRIALVCGLVVAETGLLFALPMLSAPREVEVDLAPVRYLQAHLGEQRFFSLGPLQPNYGAYWGIASLNSNDLPSQPFFDYVRRDLDRYVDPTVFVGTTAGGRNVFAPSPQSELTRNLAGYRAAGVAYVLSPAGQPLPRARGTFTLVFRSPSTWIYRLSRPAPYFSATGCGVRGDGRRRARISCPRASTLVRRETQLPGWRAQVDGHAVAVGRHGPLFQAVAIPAGTHDVRFAYRPPHILWSLPALAAGLAGLGLAAVRRRRLEHGDRPADH